MINISRNPYWGRINECYGEDPCLTGRMGVAFVRGLQGDDARYLKLAATLKHFAVNNVEKDRQRLSAKVDERMLHEYWLPHFRECVVEGKVCSVMASYNAINGTPNNVNHLLLTDILKKQWGFQGFVVSDLGGVQTMVQGHRRGKMDFVDAVAQSLEAGCDFSDTRVPDVHSRLRPIRQTLAGAAGRRPAPRAPRPLPPRRVRSAGEISLQPDFS